MRRLTKTGAAHVTNCSFDQTIAVNVICLSFACLFLFPASTQYPAGSPNLGGGALCPRCFGTAKDDAKMRRLTKTVAALHTYYHLYFS